MKSMLHLGRLLLVVAFVFTAAHAAAEKSKSAADGLSAGTVVVPAGLKADDVQQAILLAGSGRGWAVKDKADGKIVLFLEQGGWRSELSLTYDAKEIQIFSNSGKPDKSGAIKKQAIPTWVNFLKQDITKHLGAKAFGK